MTYFSHRLTCKVLAVFMLIMVITHWKVALMFFNPLLTERYLGEIILGMLLLLLNLVAGLGLYQFRAWGFIVAYVAIAGLD